MSVKEVAGETKEKNFYIPQAHLQAVSPVSKQIKWPNTDTDKTIMAIFKAYIQTKKRIKTNNCYNMFQTLPVTAEIFRKHTSQLLKYRADT